ncbi:MAG: hypothetical protein KZQ94_09815 [Candidatus Thiodiazotropha sp. (ex Troendleina suluensis)]|nr:hypothetical protein [Candidatus Thiodiazotropha sp. (ex Troendleina suluensis)]
MQTNEVITQLAGMGITLEIDGDSIWAYPKTALTDDACQLIRLNKPALLDALRAGEDTQILANAFYNHLFGEAKRTNCCYAKAGRLCAEGRRLRDAYYLAERRGDYHVH